MLEGASKVLTIRQLFCYYSKTQENAPVQWLKCQEIIKIPLPARQADVCVDYQVFDIKEILRNGSRFKRKFPRVPPSEQGETQVKTLPAEAIDARR
jgi:hypothetical protein